MQASIQPAGALTMKYLSTFTAALLLILASPLVLAKKPDCNQDPTHPSCGGGDDPLALPYLVEIKEHIDELSISPLYQPYDLDTSCLAEAHDHISNFNVVFRLDDRECAILTTDEDYSVLPALGINVTRDKKSGAIIEAYFLGGGPADLPSGERYAHMSDNMVNTYIFPEYHGDGSFTLHLHADGVVLNKCDTARLKNNTVCIEYVGKFAMHDLHYYPNPLY